MAEFVKVDTAFNITVIPCEDESKLLDVCYEAIGNKCDIIELVYKTLMQSPYVAIVDEESLLKDNELNMLASTLCSRNILGNILIGKVGRSKNGGEDILPLDSEDIKYVKKFVEFVKAKVEDMLKKMDSK